MARHHYVPGSVLGTYASAEAWRLVRAPKDLKSQIAKSDAHVMDKGQRRHWPLCVYDKNQNVFERRLLGKVCSSADFYSLPKYDDPLLRGMVRQNLEMFDMEEPSTSKEMTEDELTDFGKEQLEIDRIEKQNLASLDGNFARLIQPIRQGKILSSDEVDTICRFLVLARYRSPVWRRVYHPIVWQNVKKRFLPMFENMRKSSVDVPAPRITDYDFFSQLEKSFYLTTIFHESKRQVTDLHKAKINIYFVHAPARVKFIISDNSGRAYYSDRIKSIQNDRLPGILERNAQIAYPIAPDACIVASINKDFPHLAHVEISATEIKKINTALAIIADAEIVFPSPYMYLFEPWLDITNIPRLRNP